MSPRGCVGREGGKRVKGEDERERFFWGVERTTKNSKSGRARAARFPIFGARRAGERSSWRGLAQEEREGGRVGGGPLMF